MRHLLLLALLLPLTASAQNISQANWKLVSADSANAGYPATAAFDGNASTFWHTDWQTNDPPQPHEIQIDLGTVYNLTGFTYTSRQDGGINGNILQYNFYVSTDLTQPWTLVSNGSTGGCSPTPKTFQFVSSPARYIRLQSTSSCNGNWTNIAELNVTGTLQTPPPPFVWVMPGLGTATFPMQIPPACGPSDGTCSIQIQVCDTSKTPPVCMTASQGTITLLKNVMLPAPQQQAIPLVTVTP